MKVTIRTLADLERFESGVVGKAFEEAFEGLLKDLRTRAAMDKPRTLTVKLELRPVADDRGELAEVKIDVSIAASQPASKTRTISARAIGPNAIGYDDLTPDNVHQQTMNLESRKEAS